MSKSTLHRRQISWMGWLAALALLLTSCGGPDPQPSPDSSSAATVTQELGETVTSRTGENTGAPSETGETDGPTTESPVPPQTTVHTADPQPTKKLTPAPAGFLKPFQKEAGYRIVRGSSAEEKEAAAAVQEAVYKSAGIRLEVVTATQSQSAGQTEILIGNTGRPETKTAKNWLGKDSLIIAAVEQKLVILGGDPAGTLLAADVFVSEYVTGPDAAFPRDLQAVYGVEDTIAYGEYTNNSAVNANDPWVVRDGDGYYYCWSENGIAMCGGPRTAPPGPRSCGHRSCIRSMENGIYTWRRTMGKTRTTGCMFSGAPPMIQPSPLNWWDKSPIPQINGP